MYPSSSGRILGHSVRAQQPLKGAKGPWTGLETHPCHTQHGLKEVLQFLLSPCPKPGQSWGQNFAHKTDVIEGFSGSCFNNSRWNLLRVWLCPVPHWGVESWRSHRGGGLCCCKSPKASDGNKKMEINGKEQFWHCNDSSWWLLSTSTAQLS